VRLDSALDGCERILKGEFDGVSERAMYMIGGIDEVADTSSASAGGSGGGGPESGEA